MSSLAAAIFVTGFPQRFIGTAHSLRRAAPDMPIYIGSPETLDSDGGALLGERLIVPHLTALVQLIAVHTQGHVLIIGDGVEFPDASFDPALALLDGDVRVATVSFWSNSAGPMSFPHWHHQVAQPPVAHNATTLTRLLRTRTRDHLVPVQVPAGGAVLLGAAALSALAATLTPSQSIDVFAADYGLRAIERGLINVVDPSTYLLRSSDNSDRAPDTWLRPEEHAWLEGQHRTWPIILEASRNDSAAPAAIAHRAARTAVTGFRILVDGGSLGPIEMGTQVQTLSLIAALSDRPDVCEVWVAMPGPTPAYASDTLDHPKVRARLGLMNDLSPFGDVDIVHRPFQPDFMIDFSLWRRNQARAVVTLQDLIAYRNPRYHTSGQVWLEYRQAIRHACAAADAVVAISQDVVDTIRDEALPVAPDRVHLAPNGTDHLSAGAEEQCPAAFSDPALAARRFLLVLGANYAHKNRDLAIEAFADLRRRGHSHVLVLAGATVPQGASSWLEARARGLHRDIIDLPDVSGPERIWLLRHADLLLYPTAAEGFGLLPYEAATLGTPTVWVRFGPLTETAGPEPTASSDWSPAHLADAAEALLSDPSLSTAQNSRTVAAGDSYRWAQTAQLLVQTYDTVLRQPQLRETAPTSVDLTV